MKKKELPKGRCIDCAHAFVKWDGVMLRGEHGEPRRNPYICVCTAVAHPHPVSEGTPCYNGKFKVRDGELEVRIIRKI